MGTGTRVLQVLRMMLAVPLAAGMFAISAPPAQAAANYNPGPVTNIGATPTSGALAIYWTAPSFSGVTSLGSEIPIVKYEVKVTQDGSKASGTCTTVAPGCVVKGLTNGVKYWVEIRATNSYYYTSWTGGGPFTPCCSVPSAPTQITATAGDSVASVTWGPPANAAEAVGPFSYAVTSSVPGVGCTTTGTSCSFSGLTNGVVLVFSVAASSPYGAGPVGLSTAVTPMGLPGAPTDVRAYLGKGAADVWWTGPASTGGSAVTQYVAVSSPGGLTCVSPGGLSCRVRGLSNGTTYTFTVTAYNRVGAGPASTPSAAARLLAGPGAPTAAKARVSGTTASISWLPPRSTGGLKVSRYVVTSTPGKRTCTTKGRSCVISGLSLGTRYVFSVVAYNGKGAGVPKVTPAVATASPPAPPPPAAPAPPPVPKPEQPLS